MWSSSEKSHWNVRVKEVSGFYIRHYCKTKTSRGSEHYFWNLSGPVQELQKWSKLYVWFKESFRMLNQYVMEIPTLPVDQCHSHLIQFPERMLSRSIAGVPSRREGPSSIWDTHWNIGKRFCKSSMQLHQHLILKKCINGIHRYVGAGSVRLQWKRVKGNQTPDQDLKCQSGPVSQRNSVILSEEGFWRNYGADHTTTADFGSSFWQILHTSYVCLLEDKIQDWGLYSCSQFPTEALQWIKEVEMVDSVDGFKIFVICKRTSNARFWSTPMRGLLQHWTKSSIILISKEDGQSWGTKSAQKQGRFLRGRQIAYLIYEYFRVTGSQWFCRELCRPIH